MGDSPLTVPRVGIVGAGQLARMTLQAGISLGLTVRVLANSPDESAALVSPAVSLGAPTSINALSAFAATCDVVTFDHELVDAALLRQLEAAGHVLRPSAATMAVGQDKLFQRREAKALGLPIPPCRPVCGTADILTFAEEHGWPVVLKARRGGYDGRGVWVVTNVAEAGRAALQAQARGLYLLAEQWVPIEREVAVLVARRPGGQMVVYPVVETVQVDGICHEVLAPAPVPPALAEEVRAIACRLAVALDVSGILAVELFVTGGKPLVNELAVRPHNTGHYSIEACATSQFENHLRGVLDWPLGVPEMIVPAAVMVNVLGRPETGDLAARLPAALAVEGVRVHLYAKASRPGRKIGHVTAVGADLAEARARARRAAALLAGGLAFTDEA
jgi:5-(carboxyamino)imidazole ribonucleotide synthase